jgi:hypothetical protein
MILDREVKYMISLAEAIIEAFENLGRYGPRSIKEIEDWLSNKYPGQWKDVGTEMADMVPTKDGGNRTSNVPDHLKVLQRIDRGKYRLR